MSYTQHMPGEPQTTTWPSGDTSTKRLMSWLCDRCGALVGDQETHDRFHAVLDRGE